nr:cytochrome c oxidase subunit II [Janibacter corallicola]
MIALSACSAVGIHTDPLNGYLPEAATREGGYVEDFWIWTWVAAWLVGIAVWGMTLWCIVVYRRRKNDDGTLPVQLQYNVPLEILYTVVPMMMVGVIFFYNVQAQDELGKIEEPDVVINVVAKQWSWDFNYVNENVHTAGQMAQLDGTKGAEKKLPTLYLPKGERVEFVLTSRDVIHSFWVPAFLEKMDVNPGIVNRFQVTPTQEGTFQGKCAELCGAYHSQMLFNVKIVDKAEYEAHIQKLKKQGDTGLLKNGLNRDEINKRDTHLLPEGVRN